MARDKVQFQKGLSEVDFLACHGRKEQSAKRRCEHGNGLTASCARSAADAIKPSSAHCGCNTATAAAGKTVVSRLRFCRLAPHFSGSRPSLLIVVFDCFSAGAASIDCSANVIAHPSPPADQAGAAPLPYRSTHGATDDQFMADNSSGRERPYCPASPDFRLSSQEPDKPQVDRCRTRHGRT